MLMRAVLIMVVDTAAQRQKVQCVFLLIVLWRLLLAQQKHFINKGWLPRSLVNTSPFTMEVSQEQIWAKTFFIFYPLEYSPLVMCVHAHFSAFMQLLVYKAKWVNSMHFCVKIDSHTSAAVCWKKKKKTDHTEGTLIILFFSPLPPPSSYVVWVEAWWMAGLLPWIRREIL